MTRSAHGWPRATAASATFALNAAECVRPALWVMFAPVIAGEILALGSSFHLVGVFRFQGPALWCLTDPIQHVA